MRKYFDELKNKINLILKKKKLIKKKNCLFYS